MASGFTPITLTGTFTDDGGVGFQGTLTSTLSFPIANNGKIVIPKPRGLALGVGGAITPTVLYANTDLLTTPANSWYNITEEFYSVTGAQGTQGQAQSRDYAIQLPYNAPGGTVDISALMPGTSGGFSPTSNLSSTAQYSTFLDFNEVTEWLQFSNAVTIGTPQARILQRMIDNACFRAQQIANRPLTATTFYERHSGWSGEYIQLDYSPFLQLVSCNEYQSIGGVINLPESTPENNLEGIQIDYDTSQIMRTFAPGLWPRPFFPGSRNIEVIYVAGFNPVPPDIWMAAVDLVAYWFRNTQQSSVGFAGSSAEYGGAESSQTGLWPGIPNRISEVFESYRLPVIG